MTGQDYEYAAAHYLRWHGYHRIRITRASGDYGVDILCTRKGRRYAVQCKYYTHPVGLSAVQQAVAGKAQYGCDSAMVITNITLTRAALELAESNEVTVLQEIRPGFHLPRPLGRLLKLLILLAWLAGLYLTGRTACEVAGLPDCFPPDEAWNPVLLLLVAPLLLALLTAILKALAWRISLSHTRRREERLRRCQERDTRDLQSCENAALALSMQQLPKEAFIPAGHGPSTKRVMSDFPGSPLMKALLQAVGHQKSFTPRKLARAGNFSPEAARTLIDCLVKTGHLVCTKFPHYAWSRYSCK